MKNNIQHLLGGFCLGTSYITAYFLPSTLNQWKQECEVAHHISLEPVDVLASRLVLEE